MYQNYWGPVYFEDIIVYKDTPFIHIQEKLYGLELFHDDQNCTAAKRNWRKWLCSFHSGYSEHVACQDQEEEEVCVSVDVCVCVCVCVCVYVCVCVILVSDLYNACF